MNICSEKELVLFWFPNDCWVNQDIHTLINSDNHKQDALVFTILSRNLSPSYRWSGTIVKNCDDNQRERPAGQWD